MATKETDLEKLLSTFGILSEATNDTSLKYLKTKAQRNASSETYYQRHHQNQPSSPKNSPSLKQKPQQQHHPQHHPHLQQTPPPKKNSKFKNVNPPNQKPSNKKSNIRLERGGIKTSKSENQMTIDQQQQQHQSSKSKQPKPNNNNSKSTVADRIFESIANAIAKGDSKFEYLGPDLNNKIQNSGTNSSSSSSSSSNSSSGRNSRNSNLGYHNNINQVTTDSEREIQTDNSSSCGGGGGFLGDGDHIQTFRKFSYVQEKEENEDNDKKVENNIMLPFPPHQNFPLQFSPSSSSQDAQIQQEQKEKIIQVESTPSPNPNPFSALFTSTPISMKMKDEEKEKIQVVPTIKKEGEVKEKEESEDEEKKEEVARQNLTALILEAFHVPSNNLDSFQPIQQLPILQKSPPPQENELQQLQQTIGEQKVEVEEEKEETKEQEEILKQDEEEEISPVKKQSPSPPRRSSSSSIEERFSSSSCPSRNSIDEFLSSCDEFRGKSRPLDVNLVSSGFAQDSPTPLSKDEYEDKTPSAPSPSFLPNLPPQSDDDENKVTIGTDESKTEIRQEESSESQNDNPSPLPPLPSQSQSQSEEKKEESSIGFDGFQLFNLIASKICSVTEKMSQPNDSSATSESVSKEKVVKRVTNEVFKALFDDAMDEDDYDEAIITGGISATSELSKDEQLESAKNNLQQLFVSLTGQGQVEKVEEAEKIEAEKMEQEEEEEKETVNLVQEIIEEKKDCAEETTVVDTVPVEDWRIVFIDTCGLRCEPFCIAYDVPF